jgi:anti-anti-sigma factor
MNITEREEDGISVFTLEGRVDSEGAIDLDLALQTAVSAGRYKMVLEMSDLRYISSAGLRTLADILTRNQAEGGDLKLVNLNPKVRRVFQIIGFDKFFNMYDSVGEAADAF